MMMNIENINLKDLIEYWIIEASTNWLNKYVLVLFPAKIAYENIPLLISLKRDKFRTYTEGIKSDFLFIEFKTKEEMLIFLAEAQRQTELNIFIFSNGKITGEIK